MATAFMQEPQNHVAYVLDMSDSMRRHSSALIQLFENELKFMAERSRSFNQETRISVYLFSSKGTAKCVLYDMDVYRAQESFKLSNYYKTSGLTSLCDATVLSIEDLMLLPQKYGQHSMWLQVITDGIENNSSAENKKKLPVLAASLPGNWTFSIFVPDQIAKKYALDNGFPKDNIAIWDTTSVRGMEEAGKTVRAAGESFFQMRSSGIAGTKSLFKMNTVSASDIKSNLTPLNPFTYSLRAVMSDTTTKDFCIDNFGSYKNGQVFYQHNKTEEVQPYKEIVVLHGNTVYSGNNIRQLLGLPDYTVKVDPSDSRYEGYTIFVQSTAPNRKLYKDTKVLVKSSLQNEYMPWTGKTV
jgi:hypothetical protein